MSSVAVLTQESFAEHRSGLVPQQIRGDSPCTLSSRALQALPSQPSSNLWPSKAPFDLVAVG